MTPGADRTSLTHGLILGIETSCDECAAAVVRGGTAMLSNEVASQIEAHRPFAGVVPEIASRMHIEWIDAVVARGLSAAGCTLAAVDALAVTYRPGLIGSLLVGVSYAKGLALATGKPLVAVDHIRAHVYSPHMERDIGYPYIALLLSGGHTLVIDVQGLDRWEVLGATVDDACGEAFDKVAKHFDIGFPGGVAIQRLAERGDPEAYRFPVPSLRNARSRFDVSYSGLKTAVIHQRQQFRVARSGPERVADIAASFQKTAIDIVVNQAIAAARSRGRHRIVAAGGVAANRYLRHRLAAEPEFETFFPSLALCTDNAAMIAGLGYHVLHRDGPTDLSFGAAARVAGFRRVS